MFLKPNMMIPLAPEKKKNNVYMIDVETKEVYLSPKRPDGFSPSVWIAPPATFFLIRIRPHLYLDDLSITLQVLLAILVVVVGIFGAWRTRRMIYTPQREEYFKQYPWARKVDDVDEAIRNLPTRRAIALICTIFICVFVAGMYLFILFLDNANLLTYAFSLAASLVFGWLASNAIRVYYAFRLVRDITRPKAR